MTHKPKHKALVAFFNDDTDTPEQQAYDAAHYSTPNYGAGIMSSESQIQQEDANQIAYQSATPAAQQAAQKAADPSSSAANSFANFLGGSTLANIEKGVGGLVDLGGQVASVVNTAKGKTGSIQQPQKPTATMPSTTVLGMSPVVLIGGVIFIVAIAGVGIYLATRGGSESAASAPAGKGK